MVVMISNCCIYTMTSVWMVYKSKHAYVKSAKKHHHEKKLQALKPSITIVSLLRSRMYSKSKITDKNRNNVLSERILKEDFENVPMETLV